MHKLVMSLRASVAGWERTATGEWASHNVLMLLIACVGSRYLHTPIFLFVIHPIDDSDDGKEEIIMG